MATHPYSSLPSTQYWRTGVAERDPSGWEQLYRAKFHVAPDVKIATAGSCFAQHIGRQLRLRKYNFRDYEPAPALLPAQLHADYGYGLFSARYGNIYTARQLLQLFERAFHRFRPEIGVWQHEGRFYDPFRPSIEKGGFASEEELVAMRDPHLSAVRRMFRSTEIFVFTLGLTEAWVSKRDGAVYPVCPGVVAGEFDSNEHGFCNFGAAEVYRDMVAFIESARTCNPELKILLTVSPVPLTATAAGEHVLVATTYSKSVLRAVAGDLCRAFDFVDYFPSYEIIASAPSRAMFFEANMRSVTQAGVELVMSHFFGGAGEAAPMAEEDPEEAEAEQIAREVALVCDEEKLDRTSVKP